MLSKDELIAFEEDIAACFNNKQIRAPVHLDNGNENQLIEIFTHIQPTDWVCCTWRSHYKALLKGVPPEVVKEAILDGRSISLCFPEYNVISSAIVGGIIPIALGIADGIKRKGDYGQVYCFIGDMTARTGIFLESYNYSMNKDLPIVWVIEDNGKSVCTDTEKTCGPYGPLSPIPDWQDQYRYAEDSPGSRLNWVGIRMMYFKYSSKYPHAGAGQRIQF